MSEYSDEVANLVDWELNYYRKLDREEYFKEELAQLDECHMMVKQHLQDITDKISKITDADLLNSTPKSLKALRVDLAAWKNLQLTGRPSPADYVKKIDKILLEHAENPINIQKSREQRLREAECIQNSLLANEYKQNTEQVKEAGASFHFEKISQQSLQIVLREVEPEYLLPEKYRKQNEIVIYHDVKKLWEQEYAKFQNKKGKRPKLKNCIYDGVLNIKSTTTIDEVKKYADYLAEKFNFQITSIAIHRDSGHLENKGKPDEFCKYNYHAHIVFLTLKDCKERMRCLKRYDLIDMQDQAAKIIGLNRTKSERNHLDRKQYIQYAEDQKNHLLLQYGEYINNACALAGIPLDFINILNKKEIKEFIEDIALTISKFLTKDQIEFLQVDDEASKIQIQDRDGKSYCVKE